MAKTARGGRPQQRQRGRARSDWKDFALFCEHLGVDALPAAPAVVAGYVAELADPPDDRSPARVSTITRRLAAIGEGHKVAGHPQPVHQPARTGDQ